MRLLYSRTTRKGSISENNGQNFAVEVFIPKIWKLFADGEKVDAKTALVRIMFQCMSFGRAKIFCARDERGNLAHTSYVVPKCYKFAFMKHGDYEIGPCFTFPQYRGQGIYPYMLKYIIEHLCIETGTQNNAIYMIVNSENASSIRGIEKAGFVPCGTVYESKLLKRYFLK